MPRNIFPQLLLVFALLFAQFGGLAHGIEHTLAEQSQDQSLAQDKLCELCASYAQLGSALGSTPIHCASLVQYFVLEAAPASVFHSVAFSAFAARAPPLIS